VFLPLRRKGVRPAFLCRDGTVPWLDGGVTTGGFIVVTGTDTWVGKTVLTALLARRLIRMGVRVAALKPLASGTRSDARRLRAACGNVLSLDEVNPWWFRAALTPLVAARAESRSVKLREVLVHVRGMSDRFDRVLVEGAGGLLSPLGERFDTRDLVARLGARVIVVGANRLGAINQVLLTIDSLPDQFGREATTVLMTPRRPDASVGSNLAVLQERLGAGRVEVLPWLTREELRAGWPARPAVRLVLDRLARGVGGV
jgi:dethiobiotin synthetase